MTKQYLEKIKELFREWYGSLSGEELVTNHELIKLIEKIEAHLRGTTPAIENSYGY